MEHLTAGEWERWLTSDREFKADMRSVLSTHGERLASVEKGLERIEAVKVDAGRAENAAVTTRKWAVVGGAIAAIINGALIAFGASK